MSTNDEPKSAEEQQADDRGGEAKPAPDPKRTRAALDGLLDGRPQLATLALNLLTAALESGVVVTEGRSWSSSNIVSTVRKGRRAQMLDERERMITERFPAEQQPAAHALAQLAETRANGEKAKRSIPFMIRKAADDGMEPRAIADLLGVTTSHVYAVLRQQREQPTADDEFAEALLTIMNEHEEETTAARRRTAEEHGLGHLADEDL